MRKRGKKEKKKGETFEGPKESSGEGPLMHHSMGGTPKKNP